MISNNNDKKYAIALGYFDGLHSAHKAVINEAVNCSRDGFIPAVLLFDAHPRNVISQADVSFLLQTEKRDKMLEDIGVQPMYISFSDIREMSPEEFVRDVLVKKFNAGALCCGFNYRFGKNGTGDAGLLKDLTQIYGIKLTVCPRFTIDGEEVSSTKIRKAVSCGDIELANRMLGYPFMYSSEIFTGDRRGRLLGAPTINQFLPEGLTVPRFGVYASMVYFDGFEYSGVTNIGLRPTFDGVSVRSETYILGFSGDLYGKNVEVHLHKFIRGERKFADADALKAQISQDVKAADLYFSEKNKKNAKKVLTN